MAATNTAGPGDGGFKANGYNVFFELLYRYDGDISIFSRTLQIIDYFQRRSDWPFCRAQCDRAVQCMLGVYLGELAGPAYAMLRDEFSWDLENIGDQIIGGERLADALYEMDEENLDCFPDDLEAFLLAIQPLLMQYSTDALSNDASTLNKFYVDCRKDVNSHELDFVFRFERADGETFDFSLHESQLAGFKESIQNVGTDVAERKTKDHRKNSDDKKR